LKVLLDTCVWGGVRKALSDAGHDVVWAGDWTTDPGDEEILHRAHQETRVLVTLDKDFGELAIVRGLPHSGLIRLVNLSTSDQASISIVVLAKYGRELAAGAIITVEAARVRVRPPTDSA
jgi:predicted nuclease of predicted toxin-antitoxin system